MDRRPKLCTKISIKDFQDFYWLKEELIAFCRSEGLGSSGGKVEITNRIVNYLKSGEKVERDKINYRRSKSTFNWNTEELMLV